VPDLPWRLKLLAARARRRLASAQPDREEVVRRHAAGRTFCDVGCMWNVHGRIAFVAEEAGATAVTGVDVMAASPEFDAEHGRRSSRVRFVQGDLHEPATVADVGPHEVVWCSGVLYHAPNPVLTLQRLRELTTELLILQTMTLPELPGVKQGLVFYPGVPNPGLYARWGEAAARSLRLPEPGEDPYAPWWWGISHSALAAMLRAARFEPVERWGDPFAVHVLARPI
jgi:SAM-dependent methyltransferase